MLISNIVNKKTYLILDAYKKNNYRYCADRFKLWF